MDGEFVLTLASQSWLKWFCCPHCGSNYTMSKTGRCTECNQLLVLVRSQAVGCDILDGISSKLSFLIPSQTGSSFYYHNQWNRLVSPMIEVDNS
jgi:uncharacterized protein with PIN domain